MKQKKFIAGLLVVFLVFLVAGKYTQSKSMLNSNYVYATTVKDKKTGKEYRYEVELMDDKKAKVTKTDLETGKQTVFEEVYQEKPGKVIALPADRGTRIQLAPPPLPWSGTKMAVESKNYSQADQQATRVATPPKNTAKSSSTQTKTSQAAQSSQSKASSSQKEKDDTAKSSASSSTDKSTKVTGTATTSKLDIAAIAKGDLSSISGSYEGANGGTPFVFAADGTGSINNIDVTYTDFEESDGMATFTATDFPGQFTVIPAGMATPKDVNGGSSTIFEAYDDDTKDRILVSGEGFNVIFLEDSKTTASSSESKTETKSPSETKASEEPVQFTVTDTNNLTADSAEAIAKAFGDWLFDSDYAKDSVLVQAQVDDTDSKVGVDPHFWQIKTEDGPALAYLYGQETGAISDIERAIVADKSSDGQALDDSRSEFDLTLLGNDLSSSQAEDFQSSAAFRLYTLKEVKQQRFDSTAEESEGLLANSDLSAEETTAAMDYGYVPFYEKKVDHAKPSYQIVLASNGKVYYVTDYRITDKPAETYELAPNDMQKAYQSLLEELGDKKEISTSSESKSSASSENSASSDTASESETQTETTDGIFPPELIGEWVNTNPDDFDTKVVFAADGTVTKFYDDGTTQTKMISKVSKVEKVSDTHYRFVDYDSIDGITKSNIGGAGFDAEFGFTLDGNSLAYGQWIREIGADFDPENDRYNEMVQFTKE
ncbi:hypothetical protein [Streptococcus hyovaginalis]